VATRLRKNFEGFFVSTEYTNVTDGRTDGHCAPSSWSFQHRQTMALISCRYICNVATPCNGARGEFCYVSHHFIVCCHARGGSSCYESCLLLYSTWVQSPLRYTLWAIKTLQLLFQL